MKYLKGYKIFESLDQKDIHQLCNEYKIDNYTINDDGSIDVIGDVVLSRLNLNKLPLKFRNVSGDFYCHNSQLTTLEGCPQSVGGDFLCGGNPVYLIVHNWINRDELISYFLELDIIQDNKLIMDRLRYFHSEVGLEMDIDFDKVKKYYKISL